MRKNAAFREQYQILKNSDNTYEFKNFDRGARLLKHGAAGGIQVIDEENGIFQIQYELANPNHKSGVGKSEIHNLYEETFHAADYEAGRSSSGISNPDSEGRKYLAHDKGDRSHEARAWKFAADNAPGAPVKISTSIDQYDVVITNSLIQQIKGAKNIEQVEKLLYEKFKVRVEVPATNQAGEIESKKPLYND